MAAFRLPRQPLQAVLGSAGYSLARIPSPANLARTHPDLVADADFSRLASRVFPYTMTTFERLYALHQAVRYIIGNNLEGVLVECGVWRGGSAMMIAGTLASLEATDRELWLYDTFAGMTDPTEHDRAAAVPDLADDWEKIKRDTSNPVLAHATLDDVRRNLATMGFPGQQIRYCVGPVEETVPATIPERIALLRLDTDWYESTRHELAHLWPRLVPGGVLILDDYGYWDGARKAVDEWLASFAAPPLMHRIDETGRTIVKPVSGIGNSEPCRTSPASDS